MGHLYTALYLLSRFTSLLALYERTNRVTLSASINWRLIYTKKKKNKFDRIRRDELNQKDQMIRFKLHQIINIDFHYVLREVIEIYNERKRKEERRGRKKNWIPR